MSSVRRSLRRGTQSPAAAALASAQSTPSKGPRLEADAAGVQPASPMPTRRRSTRQSQLVGLDPMLLDDALSSAGSASATSRPSTPLPMSPSSLGPLAVQDMLVPGTRLLVLKTIDGKNEWRRAEVMALRSARPADRPPTASGQIQVTQQYYVHFVDFNKRLDEWVGIDRMDLGTAELAMGRVGGSATPLSVGSSSGLSAPGSAQKRPPKTALPDGDDDGSSTPSKEQELEQLRRGGSMTRRPEEISRVKNFDRIELGRHLVDTWYFSPYPPAAIDSTDSTVRLCEFCLAFFRTRAQLLRHRTARCTLTHPPGTEIYRKDGLSFWELDGHRQKRWCRSLCLLSKLFLDHKTLVYDVDPFLFYVLTEGDERGHHVLGYFSKEKDSAEGYNLACILTLPQHQRRGYGRLLIELSYELSRRQGRTGSPEKPLSDLGLLSYRSFWAERLVRLLVEAHARRQSLSIDALGQQTGFARDDVVHTLQALGALRYQRGSYIVVLTPKMLADNEATVRKTKLELDPDCLHWSPPSFTAADLRFL